jgi:hypothetical protein
MSSNLDAIRTAFDAWGRYLGSRDARERTNATHHRRELAALAMRLFGVDLFAT